MNNATFRATFDKVYEVGDRGYNDGYADGTQKGFTDGYEKCTEDMQDDLQAKYNEGYNNCTKDMQDDLQAKYDEGYAAGKAEAGGGSDTYGVEEMLTTLPFLRKVETNMVEGGSAYSSSGLVVGTYSEAITLFVILPWITEVQENTFNPFWYDLPFYIIFLPKTPPVVGWQGMWESGYGETPPSAIFVPDESIEAYKTETNLAAYAELIKPLSEYNGEGYYGGSM